MSCIAIVTMGGLVFAQGGPEGTATSAKPPGPSESRTPSHWWDSVSGLKNVTLKDDNVMLQLSLRPDKAAEQLQEFKKEGFGGIQIFAPEDGGKSYNGLDSRNHFGIEPKYGTMQDFQHVVDLAHRIGMRVIIFNNLGYIALDAPVFLKACDDVKLSRDSREARMFFWSGRKDAPAPATGDRIFMIRPQHLLNYDSIQIEHWEWSERAQHYYWTRWPGKDDAGKTIALPQYNWSSIEWQEEAEKTVRFWMETGIDGMIVDAVNWYIGANWDTTRKRITDVIQSYGDKYSQPEGGGAFHEDPLAWITEGNWTSVQDYGLNLWWEKPYQTLHNAIEAGDPRPVEESLRNFHDRVLSAGGILYMGFLTFDSPERQHLADALVLTTGQLPTYWAEKTKNRPATDPELRWLLSTKAAHPALNQIASRRKLPTLNDEKHYAFLRTSYDRKERVLVVTNFWAMAQDVQIDTSGLQATKLLDVRTGQEIEVTNPLKLTVDKFGYRIFQVK